MTNQATLVLADTTLLRYTVNELPATSGTAASTYTPAACCCNVASTRLAAVSATPGLVTDDFPAGTVTMPLLENEAFPLTLSALPPVVCSASTPAPTARLV